MPRFSIQAKWVFLALLVGAALILTLPAIAQQGGVSRADQKTRIETIVNDVLKRVSLEYAADNATLKQEGAVLVEDSGNYFAVTLPHLSVERTGVSRMDIGIIALNVVPGDTPKEWKITAALPTPITTTDPKGATLSTIKIGSQNFAGVYSEDFGNFSRLNARYQDLVFTENEIQGTFTIPDIKISQAYNPDGEGLWTGRTDIISTGANTAFKRSGAKTAIAEAQVVFDVTKFNPKKSIALQESMAALSESNKAGDPASNSGNHMKAMLSTMAEAVSETSAASSFEARMKGIDIILPPSPVSPAQNIHMDSANIKTGMGGAQAGNMFMDMGAAFSGLALDPAPTEIGEMTPRVMKLDMRFDRIPFESLMDGAMASADSKGLGGPLAGLAAFHKGLQTFSDAGTTFNIRDSFMGNDLYNIGINSQMKADMNAALNMTGTAAIRMSGMDNVLKSLQEQAAKPDIEPATQQRLNGLIATYTVLQMTGQKETGADGKIAHVYNINVQGDGKVLVNGQDIGPLLGLAGAAAKTAAPKAKP